MGGGGGGGVQGVLVTSSSLATPRPHRILKTLFLMSSTTATSQACFAYHAHYMCEICMDTLDAVQHNTSPNPHAPYFEKKAPPLLTCPGKDFKKKKEGMEFSQFQHSLQPALFSLVWEKNKRKKRGGRRSHPRRHSLSATSLSPSFFSDLPAAVRLCSQACFQHRQNNTVLSYIRNKF